MLISASAEIPCIENRHDLQTFTSGLFQSLSNGIGTKPAHCNFVIWKFKWIPLKQSSTTKAVYKRDCPLLYSVRKCVLSFSLIWEKIKSFPISIQRHEVEDTNAWFAGRPCSLKKRTRNLESEDLCLRLRSKVYKLFIHSLIHSILSSYSVARSASLWEYSSQ